jgi:spoIIIJ-associated protein
VNDNDDTPRERTETPTVSIDDQATVASEFVEGLLSAFGLEGAVTTRVDEDVLYIDVSGDQTEALVGARGSIMHAVLELTRTVVQRKTFGAPRMRLDIAGYAERRREALKIYAAKLAEKVLADGGEVMLEPMNPADRKVVHDAIAEIDGVRSYSEGEDPERCVIVAAEG